MGERTTEAAPAPPGARLSRPHRAVFVACAAGLLLAMASRSLHYASAAIPPIPDALLGEVLIVQVLAFANVSALQMFYHPTLLVLLLLAFWKLLRREGGLWYTRPWVHSAIWIAILLHHYLFDVDPRLAWGAVWTIAIASPLPWRVLPRRRRWLRRGIQALVWAIVFAVWLRGTRYYPEILAILLWTIPLVLLFGPLRRFLLYRDRLWLGALAAGGIQLFAAVLPWAVDTGQPLGSGAAYSFCEVPERGKLYAVLPECPTLPRWFSWEACKMGYVAEYDRDTFELVAEHRFFSDRYYGRMEQLTCMGDVVQIGMSSAVVDGEDVAQSAMEFRVDDPRQFRTELVGEAFGDRIAYDANADAVFYVGEWSDRVVRVDRATGARLDRVPVPQRGFWFLGRRVPGSLLLSRFSMHEGRNSIFVAEWLGGTSVQELDRDTLEPIRSYRHNNGGAVGVAVDEEMARLYVTGLWGMEVFDLDSGELVARHRLGFFDRVPLIDKERDLVFVASTVSGKVQAFDRRTGERLGSMPLGLGVRHPYLTRDGRHLIAGSERSYRYWETGHVALGVRSMAR